MKTPLIALFALALTLPLGCSSDPEPPNPLATRSGFCDAWAQNACSEKVVEYCAAKSAEACQETQHDVCMDLIPSTYSADHAESCLRAVADAYVDGDLTAEELAVVKSLAAPCDMLSTGTSDEGDSCTENNDCNTAGGFVCIVKLGDDSGTCVIPEEVGAGEDCSGPKQTCKEGFYCNDNCVAQKATGKACTSSVECKPTDKCVPTADDATKSTCETRLDNGEVCAGNGDCKSGYCALVSGETEGECVSTIRLARSEPLCAELK
jgi:hypothetical protein